MNKRPKLSEKMNPEDLVAFYWLKSELRDFCRKSGLSTSGGKIEITERIELFFKTGKKLKSAIAFSPSKRASPMTDVEVSLDTQVGTNFRFTRKIREFFESHAGSRFHFSVPLQRQIKADPTLTFQDVMDEWRRLEKLKASGNLKTQIGPQFEYNQFTRDYFSDPQNRGKTRKECIAAWREIRSKRGERKYRP